MARFPDIPPSRSTRMLVSPNVKTHRFGDGHTRYLKLGVGQAYKEWELRWNMLEKDEADQIETFLSSNDGSSLFDWTPPGATASGKYICTSWSMTPELSGHVTVQARFSAQF